MNTSRRSHTVALLLATVILITTACGSSSSADVATSATPVALDDSAAVATTVPVADPADLVDASLAPRPTAVPPRDSPDPSAPFTVGTGDEGSTVEDVQDSLNDLIGYADLDQGRIAEDGIFGPDTEAAQRAFEAFVGQPVDGKSTNVDRDMLEVTVAEFEQDAAESVVALGDESTFVGTWQTRLNVWNELVSEAPVTIAIDDRFGADTEQATLDVERALGLQIDGIVEPEDRAALRAAIRDARAETDVTILFRSELNTTPIVAKSLYTNDQYCVRFVVGFAADERCTPGLGGDVNTAYLVTVSGISFVAGTTNPNVSFVMLTTAGEGTTPLATRQVGNSLARAWATVVDTEPAAIELLEGDGTSVVEMRFSIAPTDRTDFGSTISLISEQYSHSYFIDDCALTGTNTLTLAGSLVGATLAIDAQDGVGTLRIAAGTTAAPVSITGSIEAVENAGDSFVLTGAFDQGLFEGETFSATGTC